MSNGYVYIDFDFFLIF